MKLDSLSFLVIDDEVGIRTLLVRFLERLGAGSTATASNGVEALGHLDAAKPQPDVLLVDLSMPDMGGVDLMRQLADRAYAGTIVLVSGADPETLTVAEAMAKIRGVTVLGSLMKPVRLNALAAVLGKLTPPTE